MEHKSSAIKGYEIAIQKLSETNIDAIFFLISLIILIIVAYLLYLNISKKLKTKYKYREFEKFAKEKELTEEEYTILWNYSLKLDRDPFLSLEFKSPFEKVIDMYIKENLNFNEELIRDMRKKLGFDYLPYFVPLTTTKDIDIFQGGVLKVVSNNRTYQVALYDKDELYMYWVITTDTHVDINANDIVKVNFVRKSDAAYTIESKIDDVLIEDGKVIVKIPHTFELTRIQRREYPRVERDIDAILDREDGENIKSVHAKIMNISPSGAMVCMDPQIKDSISLKIADTVTLKFSILNKEIIQKAEVVNIYQKQKVICFGVRFLDIKDDTQRDIFDFVKKQQQTLAKLHAKQS